MHEVWQILKSPASPSVKVKLYNELFFCLKKIINGKVFMMFFDDKREWKKTPAFSHGLRAFFPCLNSQTPVTMSTWLFGASSS